MLTPSDFSLELRVFAVGAMAGFILGVVAGGAFAIWRWVPPEPKPAAVTIDCRGKNGCVQLDPALFDCADYNAPWKGREACR
jgi:hypothetical protein